MARRALFHDAGVIDDGVTTLGLATDAELAAHTGDTSAAHPASAIEFTPNGSIAATDVQAAIQEVRDEAGGGGAPTTVDYLVGTADGGLSNEIVVGTTPGGELGGTWASPTVDATHSGSSHAAVQAAAEATAAAALSAHTGDTVDAHDASAISFVPNGSIAATDVQAAIQEVRDEASGGSFALEIPVGTINGINDTFTLSVAPDPPEALLLFKNGLALTATDDFTLTGATVVFVTPPATGAKLLAALPALPGVGSSVGYGTSLPGAPSDGDEYILVDSTTAPTYQWRFRYNAGASGTYKWEFVGGAPYTFFTSDPNAVLNGQTQVGATGYYRPTTGGVFTLPRAGDWEIAGSAILDTNGATNQTLTAQAFAGTTFGAAGSYNFEATNVGLVTVHSPIQMLGGRAANDLVGVCAKATTVGTVKARNFQITVVPVRVI